MKHFDTTTTAKEIFDTLNRDCASGAATEAVCMFINFLRNSNAKPVQNPVFKKELAQIRKAMNGKLA